MKLATPKGFRDFLPAEAVGRRLVLQKIISVFERFGFDPLETPTLEYAETLKGKYGEEEKLIYEFETKGGDQVALRYDQTVPTSRVAAQYPELPKPFKRYQIQSAFRGENTQRGRYREFLQCDADIIGLSSPLADAEILAVVTEVYKELGLKVTVKINDRALLTQYEAKALASIDKLNKIGQEGVIAELKERGFAEAEQILEEVKNLKKSDSLAKIEQAYVAMGYPRSNLEFDPTLVRGLNYYTGLILEVVLADNPTSSSLCGGGRYDKLIGQFTGADLPATGFAIGFDRTLEAMQEAGALENITTFTKVLVTVFSPELLNQSLEVSSRLRSNNINTEVWLDPEVKFEKQLKYADNKGIPYVVIIGPDEASQGLVTLKNLQDRSQESLSVEEVVRKVVSDK